MAFACKMMRQNLMILHTPRSKLVILGRQGLETWGEGSGIAERARERGRIMQECLIFRRNRKRAQGRRPRKKKQESEIQGVQFEPQNNTSS